METKRAFAIGVAVLIALIGLSCSAATFAPERENLQTLSRRGRLPLGQSKNEQIKRLQTQIRRYQEQIKNHEGNIARLKDQIKKTEQQIKLLKRRT